MSKRDTNLLPQNDTSLLPSTHSPPASTLRVFSLARSKFRLKEVRCTQPERLCPEWWPIHSFLPGIGTGSPKEGSPVMDDVSRAY